MTFFRALVENSSDVISLTSAAGEVLYVSASSAKVFGYVPEDLLGQSLFDLVHPEDRDQARRALREVLAAPPGPCHLEARVRQNNGEWCWVESTISNLLDDPGAAAIVVNWREIGARRAAQEQSRRQSEELARANAELQHFLYALAHDFRIPLSTISMSAELLISQEHLDAHCRALAQFVIDGVTRMSALFEGMHALAIRGFDHPRQPLDLGLVVAEVLRDLEYAIITSHAVVTLDPLPWVQGNEEHLQRVFQNLIVNAVQYHSEAPPRIHVSAESLGPGWIVRVKDNGIGIAREHHESVFGLLKRLHGPETPGAGLGLAICQKIIEASGDTIWVESEPGAGSTFCFTIQGVKAEGAASALDNDGRYLNRTPAKSVPAALTLVAAKGGGNGD